MKMPNVLHVWWPQKRGMGGHLCVSTGVRGTRGWVKAAVEVSEGNNVSESKALPRLKSESETSLQLPSSAVRG